MSDRASKISKKIAKQRKPGADSKKTKGAKKLKTGRITRAGKSGKTARAALKKTGRATKTARAIRKDDGQDLEPITPFDRGLSIGVKFAGLTALVVGLFMTFLGYLTYSITAKEIDAQISNKGVSIASTLENAVDRGFWVYPVEPMPEEDPDDPRGGRRRWEPEDPVKVRQKLIQLWKTRLSRMVKDSSGEIFAIVIVDKEKSNPNKQYQVVQHPDKQLEAYQSQIATVGEGKDKIQIFEGYLESGRRVRRFDKQIDLSTLVEVEFEKRRLLENDMMAEDPEVVDKAVARFRELVDDDRLQTPEDCVRWYEQHPHWELFEHAEGVTPWVSVFVSAARLDEVKSALWKRIALVTFCGAIAGIMLTVLIAAVLTGPVRELEQDLAEVAGGNLEHQTVVRSKDEIGALAHVFNIMTRNLRSAQENAVERKAFERELNIAAEIQEKLLPERIPQIPGFDIHSHYNSAKEVGGDYYDFIVIDQTHLGIIVADVAGKGIPGAMVMTMARSLVRLASVRNVSPGDTFKKVNRILAKDIRRGMFVTAAYMVLNVKTRTLRVASAGHNPVVLFRAGAGENQLIKPAGIALGFDKGTIFDNHIQEVEVNLKPGDRIVTYTDGVNEAMNTDSEEFGEERFFQLVKSHARKSSKEFVEAVVAELDDHRGDAEQSDDITITTLSVKAGGRRARVTFQRDLRITNESSNLSQVRETVSEVLEQTPFDRELANKIIVAVDEALANVVEHAYGGGIGKIHIIFELDAERFAVKIRDNGAKFEPGQKLKSTVDIHEHIRLGLKGGLGMYLMRRIMDEVHYDNDGPEYVNQLVMVKLLPRANEEEPEGDG